MNRQLLIIFILPAIIACMQSPELTKEEQQSVMHNVRQTLENYSNDIIKRGLTAEFAYLDSSERFFWVPPGYPKAIGYDSVAAFIKQNAPLVTIIENKWDSLRIIPLTREYAVYTGKLTNTMKDSSGKTNSYSLIETGLMIKRKGGWKLLNGQTAIVAQ